MCPCAKGENSGELKEQMVHRYLEHCSQVRNFLALAAINDENHTNRGGIARGAAHTSRLERRSDRAKVLQVTLRVSASRWRARETAVVARDLCTREHWWPRNLVRQLRKVRERATIYEGVSGDVLPAGVFKSELRRSNSGRPHAVG